MPASPQITATAPPIGSVPVSIKSASGTPPPVSTSKQQTSQASTATPTSAMSQGSQNIALSNIVVITIAALIGFVVATVVVGSIVNWVRLRRRARENKIIEAQHRRWPGLNTTHLPRDVNPSPWDRFDLEKNASYFPRGPAVGNSEKRLHSEQIGIAVSPEIGTMGSPESRESDSSLSKLLPAKPAAALNAPSGQFHKTSARPVSEGTVFEDEIPPQGMVVANHSATSTVSNARDARGPPSSLRHPPRDLRHAPTRLHIPKDYSSPPPIIISPPSNRSKVGAKAGSKKVKVDRLEQIQETDVSSRSNSSSPPIFAAFPAPPVSRKIMTKGPESSTNKSPGSRKSSGNSHYQTARKATPSYLPDYYTDPTPGPVFFPPQTPGRLNRSGSDLENLTTDPQPPEMDDNHNSYASELRNSTSTSFESVASEDMTTSEDESRQSKPLHVSQESPLKDLHYPKVPRPSNQSVAGSPPMNQRPEHLRNASSTSIYTLASTSNSSLLEKRRGQEAALELERGLLIARSKKNTPAGQVRPAPQDSNFDRRIPNPEVMTQDAQRVQRRRDSEDDSPVLGLNHQIKFA